MDIGGGSGGLLFYCGFCCHRRSFSLSPFHLSLSPLRCGRQRAAANVYMGFFSLCLFFIYRSFFPFVFPPLCILFLFCFFLPAFLIPLAFQGLGLLITV